MSAPLFTAAQRAKMIANFQCNQESVEQTDHRPVVKIFTPDAQCTWLFTEFDPERGILFGLCDLGMGYHELGYVCLEELQSVRGALGLPVERDRHFTADQTLSGYVKDARQHGYVQT